MKTIAIACDHAGPDYKAKVVELLKKEGYEVHDFGTNTTDSVDYPEYADAVCKDITEGKADLGILICGTGIGMSIAANKHKGIRAGLCGDTESARLTRLHNNANVLCMGARIIGVELCLAIVKSFLSAEFMGQHHQKRVDMLEQYWK
ncbi:MAG: ribose 5-phosphate isomerase B [Treponema sp.]|nr:ribose 5-phosphate isomerase B [Treponema sp.]